MCCLLEGASEELVQLVDVKGLEIDDVGVGEEGVDVQNLCSV